MQNAKIKFKILPIVLLLLGIGLIVGALLWRGLPQAQEPAPAPTVSQEETEPVVTQPSKETRRETVVQQIPYATRYCYDPTLAAGEDQLLFYGIPGTEQILADFTYMGDDLLSQTVIETVSLTEPVSCIVAMGTGEKVGQPRQYPLVGEDFLITAAGECLFFTSADVYEATGYTSGVAGVGTVTACGTPARVGAVAVDPDVIPYFTKMYIVSQDGAYDYGYASAEDCGSAVNGKIIDLYFDTVGECYGFGRRDILVYFLTEGQVGEPAV